MPSTTSPTVSKSSSVGLPNLFMLKCVRDSENLLAASFTSRQPELSLTTNLYSKLLARSTCTPCPLLMDEGSNKLAKNRTNIRKAAAGFLRTYRYLIRHETDFNITQQEHLCLIPQDIDWPSFCRFTAELSSIDNTAVSGRHCYGELGLTRLNLYAQLLLRKFHFEQVHNQYGDFYARQYGPILFVFALVSTILSSMQVALAAEQLVTVQWASVWYVSRWFSVISLVGSAVIAGWFVLLWLWMVLDEWVYTSKRKLEKRAKGVVDPKC